MKVGVYPGSFDPVTLGHLDIISRSALLFDRLYVAVLNNSAKSPTFTTGERIEMLREVTGHLGNVVCESFDGLVVEDALSRSAVAMVRGLRAVSDFEYEFRLTSMNRHLRPEVETIYMMTSTEYSFVSSSIVKEVASLGGNVSAWVSEGVGRRLARFYANRHLPHAPGGESAPE